MNMDDVVLSLVNPDVDAQAAAKAVVLQKLETHNKHRTHLKSELKLVDNDIRTLQQQWNTMAPISRLPPEILSIAFEVFVADYCESRMTGHTHGTSLCGWLVILHICHHWRSVALDNPELWTRIELRCEPYVRFMLAHSGNLPLTVFPAAWWSPKREGRYSDTIIQSLFPEFLRLRIAQFRITSFDFTFDLAHKEGKKLEAPKLETLALHMDTGVVTTRFPLLSNMELTSLTSLTIKNGAFTVLQPFLRPILTTLDLSFRPECRPSSLVEVLDGLPLLRHLALSGLRDNDSSFHLGHIPRWCHTIPFLQLRTLSLKGHLYSFDIVHLLECLEFPADTEIKFAMVIEGFADFTERYHQIMPRVMRKSLVCGVSAATEATQTVIPRAIEVLQDPTCPMCDVVLWPSLRPWDRRRTFHVNPAAARTLHLSIATREELAIIRFFSLLDLSEVVVMDLEHEYDADVWKRAFRNRALPKLQDLILRGYSAVEGMLSAMSSPLPSATRVSSASSQVPATGEDIRRYLFPALKTLTLVFFQFRSRPGKILRGDQFSDTLKALRVRAKHGYRLEKLVIRSPINLTRKEDRDAFRDPRIADSVEIDFGSAEDLWDSEEEVEESDIDSNDDVNILPVGEDEEK